MLPGFGLGHRVAAWPSSWSQNPRGRGCMAEAGVAEEMQQLPRPLPKAAERGGKLPQILLFSLTRVPTE